jgi:MFS family permease
LYLPYGAAMGFVSVALAFLATRRGLSVQQGALMIATFMGPQVWKFLLAPVADTTLSRRRWYLLSAAMIAAGLFATAAVPLGPATFQLIEVIILLSSVATSFLGFAVEAMVAHLTPAPDVGRVSGWLQAGNLGGSGIGGGLGLWLLTVLPAGWETGLILAVLTLSCAAALALVPDIPADPATGSLAASGRGIVVELWRVVRSRSGAMCALLCFVPVGTGTATGVLGQADVAAYWGVGSATVSLIQGVLGGLVSMAGCIAGGYGCVRLGARAGYAVYGAIMAAVALAMALLPATPRAYELCSLAYWFTTGLTYAAFSAFVLEAIGAKLAATKYNAFASLSNFPIWYMGLLLAAVETGFGPRGMLAADSLLGVAGILVFAAAAWAWRPDGRAALVPATGV